MLACSSTRLCFYETFFHQSCASLSAPSTGNYSRTIPTSLSPDLPIKMHVGLDLGSDLHGLKATQQKPRARSSCSITSKNTRVHAWRTGEIPSKSFWQSADTAEDGEISVNEACQLSGPIVLSFFPRSRKTCPSLRTTKQGELLLALKSRWTVWTSCSIAVLWSSVACHSPAQ